MSYQLHFRGAVAHAPWPLRSAFHDMCKCLRNLPYPLKGVNVEVEATVESRRKKRLRGVFVTGLVTCASSRVEATINKRLYDYSVRR